MKVLIIANYAKEHINKFHLTTIERFKQMGWQVDVACNADAEVPGADHVFDLPMERNPYRLQTFKAIKMLKKILAEGGYDVVHCHTYAGKFIGILAAKKFRKNGLKVIYSAHGLQYYSNSGKLAWIVFKPIDKWLVKNVDVLITSNSEDYETVHKYNFKAKYIEKCCGVGFKPEKFLVKTKPRDEVRNAIGVPLDAFELIYVAELNYNKNQKMLLRMFERIKDEIKEAHLVLVGPDYYDGKIQNIAKEMGLADRVHCLGWRSDVPDLIKAADIAVASSYREGFGLNIVEYQACGVPVVTADNRGHREIIEDGKTGYLVARDDDEAMADRVLKLYKDLELRERITQSASEAVVKFEDKTIVDEIVDIYQRDIVGEKQGLGVVDKYN